MCLYWGRNYRSKYVELIEIINKIIIVAFSWLFMLFYQRCTDTQTPNARTYTHSYCQAQKREAYIQSAVFFFSHTWFHITSSYLVAATHLKLLILSKQ